MRLLVVAATVAAVAFGVAAARGAPTPITLTFDGIHAVDGGLPAGIRHEGRFTASSPLCLAGKAVDVRDIETEPLTVLRTYTCDDGSGTFTALLPAVAAEHGGTGSWRIVDGTGRYATLRGIGSYEGHLVSGDPGNFPSIVYRTTWHGVVDFDAVAPALTATARVTKLRRSPRTYLVRTTLDAGEASFSYSVDIRGGGRYLALKKGMSPSSRVTVTARIRVTRQTRNVRILITAADAVGNERTTTLTLRLQ